MLVWERQNNRPVAIFYGKQAVNVFQEIRGNIKTLDKESQQSYLKSHEDAYRKLADLLISQGRLAEAEKVLELLKEEEFNRIIRRNGPSDLEIGLTRREAEAAKITDQLASLASERGSLLAKIEKKTATDQDRQRLALIETTITQANKQIKLVLADITKASPDDKIVTQQSQSMMQSLRKLGPGAVALYTVVTDEKGWVILTTPDFRRAYSINTTGLNQTISDFRLTLKTDRYDPVPLAQKLYTALFLQKNDEGATLAADLKSYRARTLMWSLDGVLRYVPVGALHDGKGYLVERYPTLVFTTASLTRLLDQVQGNWRAFGLGVSKEYKDFPALTAVPREMRSIINETGVTASRGVLPGVIRLDEQFTRKAMIDGLHEGYPIVHIASHFRFNAEREETSFLLLGDGSYFSLEEMQNSPGIFEKVELLTLSACDTATSGANGKEVEGLAFVAQDLGAKAVVASLWPVADEGTEVLMREFYQLKQKNPQWSKAEALRQAQMTLLKGKASSSGANEKKRGPTITEAESGRKTYRRDALAPFGHPHYWAPFILIGNWK
jgi:CHAT domain-containing protein